jgi:predicted helicase
VKNNAVSRAMQDMIEVLEAEGMEMDTSVLDKFYTSVKNNVSNIDNLEGKQTIIKNLYEKFFKGAFPLTVEKLGIVYTPVECVDFIIHSVEDILQQEFNTSLTNENVHILDPFVGTGTFITRLLQSGIIKKEDMLRKYREEIHCNEIVLLAYYIADVNIESVYHDIMHPEKYENYDGICLTDTFQLNEHGDNDIFSQLFPENSERLKKQKNAPVRVIIGNPPYSVGQKNANDNAQNLKYPQLDSHIERTYVKYSTASLGKSLYDSYVKAFRWASDRISQCPDGGIIAFISNGSWIDSNALDGMRKSLFDEFSSIYVFNMRGNTRTSGELARKEGGQTFGSGCRTTVAITFLVKNPHNPVQSKIYYHDIGDYLTREQKLSIVHDLKSICNVDWCEIHPNDKNDWINQRDGSFDELLPLVPSLKFNLKEKSFFSTYLIGVSTNRDAWVYGYSKKIIEKNITSLLDYYDTQRIGLVEGSLKDLSLDATKISWTVNLKKDVYNNKPLRYIPEAYITSNYRPFCKMDLYYDKSLIERPGIWNKIRPAESNDNIVICITGGNNGLSSLIAGNTPDLHYCGDTQCFPLYWYEENKNKQRSLFDDDSNDDYIKRDGITDWILKEVRTRYGTRNITKEMIFYYVYGLLHSKDYRERFAADLKKSLPRIPIVDSLDDFMDFYKAGKELADLHLNYETVAPYPDVIVHGDRQVPLTVKRDPATGGYIQAPADDGAYDYFRVVDKMRFKSKDDKSTIIYNGNITIENIPQKAYDYIVNGKSAIEWIVERYAVTQDKKSLIKNDANDWAREHHKPRYILDLLLSVINVSVQTVDIVNNLPKLKFE